MRTRVQFISAKEINSNSAILKMTRSKKTFSPDRNCRTLHSVFRHNPNSIAGYVAFTGEILNIPDVYTISRDAPYHFASTYDTKSNYKTKSMITVPMKNNLGKIIGVLQMINAKNKKGDIIPFPVSDEPFVIHFATTASIVLQRAQMTRALLLRMISMAELRDPKETGQHVNRVASYSVELYERWAIHRKIPREEIDRKRDVLRMAAMLHDVGKVAISDLILKKAGPLSAEEYEVMKTHTSSGGELLGDIQSDFDEIASVIARTHHENWDGTGYPANIKGEDISIYGRITALADVYDALSSKRVYKNAWNAEDVYKEIKSLSGKKFDPELIDIFFDSLELIESIRHRYPDE